MEKSDRNSKPWHELYVFASSSLDEAELKALADELVERYQDILIVVYNPAGRAASRVPGPDTVQ